MSTTKFSPAARLACHNACNGYVTVRKRSVFVFCLGGPGPSDPGGGGPLTERSKTLRPAMPSFEQAAVTCARQALMVCGAWRWYGRTVLVRAVGADGVALGGVRAPERRALGPCDATIKDAVSSAEYTGIISLRLPEPPSMRASGKAGEGVLLTITSPVTAGPPISSYR